MTTRIEIDPNVRVRGNCTYAGFEDVVGVHQFAVGDDVEVVEPEADLAGQGRIVEIDVDQELIYLAVDWSTLKPRQSGVIPEATNYKAMYFWLEVSDHMAAERFGVSRPHYLSVGTDRLGPGLELVAG